jgi:putative transposase
MLNAILYITRSGCSWRMMPHDLPPWQAVYAYFRKLLREGLWERLNDGLREQVRQQAGREAHPSTLVVDSQSVKTAEKGGHAATMVASASRDASGISS